jgi:hypothetical protein
MARGSTAAALIQALGEPMGVSRVYVFRFDHGDSLRASQIQE